ncbi:MAG TPA: DUF1934 domain-containing protein [Clostridiales bacterium]|nr:DUF1934 domain-containing protein [Clostridiales bacterium]
MKKNVLIEMKSIQIVSNDEKSEMELTTTGTFDEKDGEYIISYEDSEATGFEGSVTDITVKKNEIASIIRSGASSSNLIIEHRKKHFCHYATPFGEFIVGINTKKIENNLTSDGGILYMKYTIDLNSSYMSDNEIILNIKNLN